MKERELERQKGRVMRLFSRWRDRLWLYDWRCTHYWKESMPDGQTSRTCRVAEVECSWQYREAYITWFLGSVAEIGEETLERSVVHECLHIHLEGVTRMHDRSPQTRLDLEEHVVSGLEHPILEMGREIEKLKEAAREKRRKKA